MFDAKMKNDFPEEWQMSFERMKRNRRSGLPEGRLWIPGIGSVPRPHLASTEVLFDALGFLLRVKLDDQFEGEHAKKKFDKAMGLYEREIISLIGTWSDPSLEFVSSYGANYRKVSSEYKLAYLKRLRKSSLASYF